MKGEGKVSGGEEFMRGVEGKGRVMGVSQKRQGTSEGWQVWVVLL